MTLAERREASAGVSRITDYLPGIATPFDIWRCARNLEDLFGRVVICVGTEYDDRGTIATFSVDQD